MVLPKLRNINNLGSAKIYRTNDYYGPIGMSMNTLYTNPNKGTYFVLDPKKLSEYFARVGQQGKGFTRKEANHVKLLDMSDPATVIWVKEHATAPERLALEVAFPDNADVKRFSSGETKHLDDESLAAIARIIAETGIHANGYYSAEQKVNGITRFHEEVGIIPQAFGKFTIIEHVRSTAPRALNRTVKRRSRIEYNDNSNNDLVPKRARLFGRGRSRR
jgi:hypothetical protein